MKTFLFFSVVIWLLAVSSIASGQDLGDLDGPTLGVYTVEVAGVYDELKKNDLKLPTRVGVLVMRVETNSPADKAKIKKHDIIQRIQRETIRTGKDFVDVVSGLKIGREYVLTGYRASERGRTIGWKKGTTRITPLAKRDVFLNAMTKKEDEVRGIVFWQHAESPTSVNTKTEMYCYIVQSKDTLPTLRLQLQYVASDWLFVHRVTIKADDQTFTLDTSGIEDMNRDHDGGRIWEWQDRPVGSDVRKILEAITKAKSVTVRYEGRQYNKDREMSDDEVHRIRTVMAVHEILAKS